MKGRTDKLVPVMKWRKVDMSMKVISDKSYFDVFEKYEKKDKEKQLKKVKLHEERNKWVKKVETTVKSRKKTNYSDSESNEKELSSVMEETIEEEAESSEDEVEENLENFLL